LLSQDILDSSTAAGAGNIESLNVLNFNKMKDELQKMFETGHDSSSPIHNTDSQNPMENRSLLVDPYYREV
jgi:hypothetical protein